MMRWKKNWKLQLQIMMKMKCWRLIIYTHLYTNNISIHFKELILFILGYYLQASKLIEFRIVQSITIRCICLIIPFFCIKSHVSESTVLINIKSVKSPAQNRWTVDSGQKIGHWPVDKKLDSGQWTVDSGQWTKNWTLDSGQKIVSSLFSFYKLRIYYFHENIQILIKFYYVL